VVPVRKTTTDRGTFVVGEGGGGVPGRDDTWGTATFVRRIKASSRSGAERWGGGGDPGLAVRCGEAYGGGEDAYLRNCYSSGGKVQQG